MKIAISHLRHADIGGVERFQNQLSAALAARGHDVTILCRTYGRPHHPAITFISFRSFAPLGSGNRLWRFAKDIERHVARHDYDLVLGLGRTWSQDIIRAGQGLYRDQIEKGLGRRRRMPRDLISEAIERRTFAPNNYKMVLSNSYQTQRSLAAAFAIPKDKMTTIHNAVSLERFNDCHRQGRGRALRRQCGFDQSHRVYLFLGMGFKRKGLDRLLHAFPQVAAREPNSRLMIVGSDSQQKKYANDTKRLGIDGKVAFLGSRTDAEICYNAADIYVMPSRFDAFGFSALEALACGLPVVITDTAGASEVMTPAVGEVIPSLSTPMADTLSQAMLSIEVGAENPQMRSACKKVAANYAEDIVINKYMCVLERVFADKKQV